MAGKYEDSKSLKAIPNPNGAMLIIVWEGGGQVPAELSGLYSTPQEAKKAIRTWYAANKREEQVNEEIEVVTLGNLEDKKHEKRLNAKANKLGK